MISTTLKKINALRAEAAALEAKLAAERTKELKALPAQYGFASLADFIAALSKLARSRPAAKRGQGPAAGAPAAKPRKRRRRAVITEATRAEVKKLVAAGKSGAEIAQAVRISVPSVQNIKRALGLVKKK